MINKKDSTLTKFYKVITEIWAFDAALKSDLKGVGTTQKTIYGLDTTEFHNFLFPFSNESSLGYIEDKTSKLVNLLLNETLTKFIFKHFTSSLTILPPHLIEVRKLLSESQEIKKTELMNFIEAESKIHKSDVSEDIIKLSGGLQSFLDKKITESKFRDLIYSCGPDVVPYIVTLKNKRNVVENKIKKLFDGQTVSSFASLFPKGHNIDVDKEVFLSCFEKFEELRPNDRQTANSNDAYAFSLAHSINQHPELHSYQVRLISRADTMFEVEKHLMNNQRDNFNYIPILRHPITFFPMLMAERSDQTLAQILSQREAIVSLLSKTYERRNENTLAQEARGSVAVNKANKFFFANKNLNKLILFEELFSLGEEELGDNFFSNESVLELLNLLKGKGDIQSTIEELAGKLIAEIEGSALMTSAAAYSSDTRTMEKMVTLKKNMVETPESSTKEEGAKLKKNAVAARARRPVWIAAEKRISLQSIAFYEPEIHKLFLSSSGDLIDYNELVSKLMRINYRDYESRLAIAYVFALQQKWDWAFRFSKYSLKASVSRSSKPRHEGYYLSAVSRRHNLIVDDASVSNNPDPINLCLEDLLSAHSIFRSSSKLYDTYFDIRLISEIGICKAVADRDNIALTVNLEDINLPTVPVEIWELGLKLGCSQVERLILYNNITYFSLQLNDGKLIDDYAPKLIDVANSVTGKDLSKLPDNILDTILTACSKRDDLVSSSQLISLIQKQKESSRLGIAAHDTPFI